MGARICDAATTRSGRGAKTRALIALSLYLATGRQRVTKYEVAEMLGVSTRTALRYLHDLYAEDLAEPIGEMRPGVLTRWRASLALLNMLRGHYGYVPPAPLRFQLPAK